MLGIRLPQLRRLASRIAKGDWENYLFSADTFYMEERMLQGMVLGAIRPDADIEVYLNRVTRFVRIINSWSSATPLPSGEERSSFPPIVSVSGNTCFTGCIPKTNILRFGVVMTLRYFVDEAHLPLLLHEYDSIRHEGTMCAWLLLGTVGLLCEIPEQTMAYLRGEHHLDDLPIVKRCRKSWNPIGWMQLPSSGSGRCGHRKQRFPARRRHNRCCLFAIKRARATLSHLPVEACPGSFTYLFSLRGVAAEPVIHSRSTHSVVVVIFQTEVIYHIVAPAAPVK